MKIEKKALTFIEWDYLDRPVYRDEYNKFWKDIQPMKGTKPSLYSVEEIVFGEPGKL